MNHNTKVLSLAILLALCAAQARADQTNLVQDLSIQLSGLKQGRSTTSGNVAVTSTDSAWVGTRDVINALGAATGNTFSKAAKLVVITLLPDGSSSVAVRDGGNSVDVSGYFYHEQQSDFIVSSVANKKTGKASSSDYSLQRFALMDSGGSPLTLHFDVRGITVDSSSTSANGVSNRESSADVTGMGDRNGSFLILQGTISVHGRTLEVVPDSQPPCS
jgi:hypothetical protein